MAKNTPSSSARNSQTALLRSRTRTAYPELQETLTTKKTKSSRSRILPTQQKGWNRLSGVFTTLWNSGKKTLSWSTRSGSTAVKTPSSTSEQLLDAKTSASRATSSSATSSRRVTTRSSTAKTSKAS